MGHGKGLLRYVVEVLYDFEKGLAGLGDCLRDAQFATYFRHEAEERGAYARRLEMTASLWKELNVAEASRCFWDFMADSKEKSDHTFLMIASQGEEVVVNAYQEGLSIRPCPWSFGISLKSNSRMSACPITWSNH
jgi:hypothetical protein